MNKPTQEHEILMVMRKILASIIKETTPPPGMQHILSAGTINDMRAGLALIAARERELAAARGVQMERPFFTDEPPKTEFVPISSIRPSDPSSK